MKQIDLGDVLIDSFDDGEDGIDWPLTSLWDKPSREIVAEALRILGPRHAKLDKGTLRLALHTFVVRTKHHVILVDTCLGNDKERAARPRFHHRNTPYLKNLRALGLSPEDVDFVFCTHMHSDHTGWNTVLENGRWVPTFPNARYVMARREYDHWLGRSRVEPPDVLLHGSFADSVLPVVEAGQALMVDEADYICDHMRLEACPGHSPGNVLVHVTGSAGAAICSGDVIHSPVQFHFLDLLTHCWDPVLSRANRKALVERMADTATLLLPAHFVDPSAGYIRSAGSRFTYDFVE